METMERTEVQQPTRTRARCAAVGVDNVRCRWQAVMAWHSVPFCTNHAPTRRPGVAGWVLL